MSSVAKLINRLKAYGIKLSLSHNNSLLVRGNKDALDESLIKEIKDSKFEIIEYLELNHDKRPERIAPFARKDEKLLLSFAQQRLWLLDRIDGGNAHYNVPGALRLKGLLDVEALSRAFSSIVERHESLRTCFTVGEDGQPVQVIRKAEPFVMAVTDLSLLSEEERGSRVIELMREEAGREFDLSGDLMMRGRLLKLGEADHILLVTLHHIASDGWSMSILINEFSALYGAYVEGRENPLAPLAIQYADYAQWQREWLRGEVLEEQMGYWVEQLASVPVVHSLPLDHPRPVVQTFAGKSHWSRLGHEVTQSLRELCHGQGATLFMGLHAAFAVLLSRYSNETDIVVGSPIANREQVEVAGLIGFFMNNLVLRSDLSGSPGFNEVLNQSKQTLLDAYAHQQVPFEQIVERLQPQRSLSHGPLFQVMLVLQNNDVGVLELPGLTVSPMGQGGTIAKYDLTLSISEGDQGLDLGWEYATDLFDAATIERMAEHFEILLRGIIENPKQRINELRLLTDAEYRRITQEWNATGAEYPRDKCIHEVFEEQVERHPDNVAVVYEDQQLTYRELNARSNQLAHYLVTERQVKPDSLVGICMERSLEMVIGILGILKSGGAYVPLDPEYPEKRIRYMLENAQLKTVLTQREVQARLQLEEEQALCLDDEDLQGRLGEMSSGNIDVKQLGLSSRHLAYVIYTSGSTGKPKGVMIEHHGVVRLVVNGSIKFSSESIALQASSASFDAMTLELYGPILNGGKVALYPRGPIEIGMLNHAIIKNNINVIWLTSGLFDLYVKTIPEVPQSLDVVIAGGDIVSPTSVNELILKSYKKIIFINGYGPTENTTFTTIYRWEKSDENKTPLPIGKPINNTKVYILNEQTQLAPLGVQGELCTGGCGLGRGYIDQPGLTAEKFIPNPFYDKRDPASSERLYKTGDLARYLPDGNIEFLGRMDHQVKIRGFRIELGEIEHALLSLPEVKEAVVVAHAREGDKYLAAYVVPQMPSDQKGRVHLEHEALRQALRTKLPEYMVPSYFVELDALPLSPNGKVDRKALLPPDASQLQTKAYVAPKTEMEQQLVQIWSEVLNIPARKIGTRDNFFQLGGHSLSATRLVNNIQSEFGVAPSVRQIFSYSNLQEMSRGIIELLGTVTKSAGEEIDFDDLEMEMPPKEVETLEVNNNAYELLTHFTAPVILNIDLKVIELDRLCAALNLLVRRHEGLRVRAYPGREGMKLKFAPKGEEVRIERVKYPHPDNKDLLSRLRSLCNELLKSFKFTPDSPLFKVYLIDMCGQAPDKLLLVWHHWIVDTVGLEIAMTDFLEAYKKLANGSDGNWPKSSHSIYHWISTQIDYARSMRGMDEARYWLAKPWEKIRRLPGDTDVEVVRLLGHQHFTVAQKQAMERAWRGDKLNKAEYAVLSGLSWNSLSKELTAQLAALETGTAAGFEIADIVLLTVFRAVREWSGERLVLMDFFLSGRTIETFGLDMSRTVCNMAYRCPIFVEEVDRNDLVATLRAIKAMRTEAPYSGAYHQAVKYHVEDRLVRQSMQRLPVPQINVNYIPIMRGGSDRKAIDGIWLNDMQLNLMTNHPRLFADDRIYIQFNVYNGRLNCGCATKGSDFEGAYFKSVYHPARSIYLSGLLIEHITGILRSLGACGGLPVARPHLITVEMQD